jgi:hypothetical protein
VLVVPGRKVSTARLARTEHPGRPAHALATGHVGLVAQDAIDAFSDEVGDRPSAGSRQGFQRSHLFGRELNLGSDHDVLMMALLYIMLASMTQEKLRE